jgi:hypothetical protein
VRGKAAGAEEAQHLGAGQRDDHAGGGDAVGHLTGDVGEPHTVGLAERAVAEPLRVQRRERAEQPVGVLRRHRRAAERDADADTDAGAGGRGDDVHRFADLAGDADDAVRVERGWLCAGNPGGDRPVGPAQLHHCGHGVPFQG